MASVPTYSPNPYANFDPSQWSNPYSNFQSSALPFPSSYVGWPTDAMGNPIQAPPGMTLNSSPAQPAPPVAPQVTQVPYRAPSNVMLGSSSGVGPGGIGSGSPNTIGANLSWPNGGGAPSSAPAAAPAPAANPSGLSSQQYLSLLAHPNYVQTPGATVPQAPSSATPGAGMLQQFLANWSPATSGPGSGFQQAFSKALRGS
jgi:hypothetical protein